MKSKAEVWMRLFEQTLANAAYVGAGNPISYEDAAIEADFAYAEFDARFYAISGGGFGPRPPKKVEGEPAPVITMPPAQE